MSKIRIKVEDKQFIAGMEEKKAPLTCAAFKALLPFKGQIIHVRWSGESVWVPLGDFQLGVGHENPTTYPSRGEILFYPGTLSETEILIPYGNCKFDSKVGPLAGNHFLTLEGGWEELEEVGKAVLWNGAKDIVFEEYAD